MLSGTLPGSPKFSAPVYTLLKSMLRFLCDKTRIRALVSRMAQKCLQSMWEITC